MMIVIAILALSLLIFVHELGHFLVAKFYKVQVLEFAIGFGPVVTGVQWGETYYAIRGVPLGGFVRMAGDTPHDVEQLEQGGSPEAPEEGTPIGEPTLDPSRWFLSQSFWPKFAIVFAGPLFNFLFALFLAAAAIYAYGKPELLETSHIGNTLPDLPAEAAGLEADDRITAIDGNPITLWDELSEGIRSSEGKSLVLDVERDGETLQVTVTPTKDETELDAIMGSEDEEPIYKIGIFPGSERVEVSATEALWLGTNQVIFITELTFKGLYGMIMGRVSSKHIAGPIFIFKQGSEAAKTGLDRLIDFMVFLSVSLALLNLLPIPVLDGGHLVFFTIEALRGAPVSIRLQERATQVGMMFLILLMLFAVTNDIQRLIG